MAKPASDTVVYISGPMSGHPDFNFPAFERAAKTLRAQGFIVISPHENFGEATHFGRKHYMRADIMNVLQADWVCVLAGWMLSKGAKLEVLIAHELGLPVIRYNGRTPVDINERSAAEIRVDNPYE